MDSLDPVTHSLKMWVMWESFSSIQLWIPLSNLSLPHGAEVHTVAIILDYSN